MCCRSCRRTGSPAPAGCRAGRGGAIRRAGSGCRCAGAGWRGTRPRRRRRGTCGPTAAAAAPTSGGSRGGRRSAASRVCRRPCRAGTAPARCRGVRRRRRGRTADTCRRWRVRGRCPTAVARRGPGCPRPGQAVGPAAVAVHGAGAVAEPVAGVVEAVPGPVAEGAAQPDDVAAADALCRTSWTSRPLWSTSRHPTALVSKRRTPCSTTRPSAVSCTHCGRCEVRPKSPSMRRNTSRVVPPGMGRRSKTSTPARFSSRTRPVPAAAASRVPVWNAPVGQREAVVGEAPGAAGGVDDELPGRGGGVAQHVERLFQECAGGVVPAELAGVQAQLVGDPVAGAVRGDLPAVDAHPGEALHVPGAAGGGSTTTRSACRARLCTGVPVSMCAPVRRTAGTRCPRRCP